MRTPARVGVPSARYTLLAIARPSSLKQALLRAGNERGRHCDTLEDVGAAADRSRSSARSSCPLTRDTGFPPAAYALLQHLSRTLRVRLQCRDPRCVARRRSMTSPSARRSRSMPSNSAARASAASRSICRALIAALAPVHPPPAGVRRPRVFGPLPFSNVSVPPPPPPCRRPCHRHRRASRMWRIFCRSLRWTGTAKIRHKLPLHDFCS